MRMMHHLAYMALRMSLYPVLTIAYQVGRFAFLVQIGFDMTFLFVFENFIDGDQDAGLFHLPDSWLIAVPNTRILGRGSYKH